MDGHHPRRRFGTARVASTRSPTLVNLDQIRSRIAPLRQSLLGASALRRSGSARGAAHVHAAPRFCRLGLHVAAQGLQRRLCSVAVPWLPGESNEGGRLINEIVLAEESDADGRGGFASHFELYQRAMRQFGAQTTDIDRLLARLRRRPATPAQWSTPS